MTANIKTCGQIIFQMPGGSLQVLNVPPDKCISVTEAEMNLLTSVWNQRSKENSQG